MTGVEGEEESWETEVEEKVETSSEAFQNRFAPGKHLRTPEAKAREAMNMSGVLPASHSWTTHASHTERNLELRCRLCPRPLPASVGSWQSLVFLDLSTGIPASTYLHRTMSLWMQTSLYKKTVGQLCPSQQSPLG